jgi:hypothetical protein
MTSPTDTAQPILSPLTNGTTIINTSPQKADKPPDLARSGPTVDHNIEHRPEDTTETGKYANPQSAASTRVISPSQSLSTPPITCTINQSHATNQSSSTTIPSTHQVGNEVGISQAKIDSWQPTQSLTFFPYRAQLTFGLSVCQ